MSNQETTMRYLLAIEKKNIEFFEENKLKIIDCVAIVGNGDFRKVHLLNKKLPSTIRRDIEAMFGIAFS